MYREERPLNAASESLDIDRITVEHRRLVAEFRTRGVTDAARHGDDIVSMRLAPSDEIEGIIDARVHRLRAACETVMIESTSFLEAAPTLQQAAQRRVAAAEAALAKRGVPASMVALDPLPEPEPTQRGFLARLLAWLMKPDDDGEAARNALRHVRKAAVDDLRAVERQMREARVAHECASRTGERLERAEKSLAKAMWAAYRDGVESALPAGVRDFGGEVDYGEPPEVGASDWADARDAA